ncbi:electron transfer flavoprotein subunit alpha/FixB family protein [uncultured Sphaerochaeta sp.]|uniref:electron transfer flavoprotein subunit alpha/FixB family protein n=1 Tax=uncultured Sphaerochaeta sp. TaxID=886478 RepID=UPI0029C9C5ED|nr:electron transfer flavoprotein subunit alpha/FixB family protein [uncultured Sphaerochaeta sp.]
MKRTLILQDTEVPKRSNALLEVNRRIYGEKNSESWLLAFSSDQEALPEGFDTIILVQDEGIVKEDARHICAIIIDLHEHHSFESILIPGTRVGRMVAPRIARRLGVGLVAEINDVIRHGEDLEFVRTAYSGNMLAGIVMKSDPPIILSIKPGIFSWELKSQVKSVVQHYEGEIESTSSLTPLERKQRTLSYDIRDSDVLISGGGGAKKAFPMLETLAKNLGGEVSASRKLVDQGIANRSIQVGQSGKIVSPRLYIAIGIDGAIQHVEGLQNVETILSVNISPDAPICSISDVVVVGEAKTFIEKLLQKIALYSEQTTFDQSTEDKGESE